MMHKRHLELIGKQKSWELWLKERDRNSLFIFASMLVRRKRNQINPIKDGQLWLTKHIDISRYFGNHFMELYESSSAQLPQKILELI